MGYVLGVSAYYHDAAAALVRDGEIVAAAQEERFSRRKHDPRFPRRAIHYCLGEAFIQPSELDAVVYYDNPLFTLDRVIQNAVTMAPAGRDQFIAACRAQLGEKARFREDLEATLGETLRLLATHHHHAHAASCFYPSPFEDAAILTIDGVGEWATCAIGVGAGKRIELLEEVWYPHSLGLLYSAFTYYCGFKVNSGEYKLMGLAPYGRPRYAGLIRERLIDVRSDGSFRIDTGYFGYLDSGWMINSRFEDLFDGPPRAPETPITQREMDLAASVQQVIEEIVLKLVERAKARTGLNRLVMAGGVALNCTASGRVLRESGLDGLFIQPAAGDAGGALGAALLVSHQLLDAPRVVDPAGDSLKGCCLGPGFGAQEVASFLDRYDVPHDHVPDEDRRAQIVARALDQGQAVGLFSGRMEFGPRALGNRSILADPRRPEMQQTLNQKIKFRESFRPFAPAVLAEHAADYFDIPQASPYMLLVAPVSMRRRFTAPDAATNGNGRQVSIPAVTHVDGSARVQTVDSQSQLGLHRILAAFHELTGCPVLVNTSFNVRGEPIVCTPHDAYRCFMNAALDLLVLEDRLIWKTRQPAPADVDEPAPDDPAPEPRIGDDLAGTFFDECLVPLAAARVLSAAADYFPRAPDAHSNSYFHPPLLGVMGPDDFEFPGGGSPQGLLDALTAHWMTAGETPLAAFSPRLKELAAVLAAETDEGNGEVDILCYTMF